MLDELNKKILFSIAEREGKTLYELSKDLGIPYQKLQYRVNSFMQRGYIYKKDESRSNGNGKKERYFPTDKLYKLKDYIVIADQGNVYLGALENKNFTNANLELFEGKIKMEVDYSGN